MNDVTFLETPLNGTLLVIVPPRHPLCIYCWAAGSGSLTVERHPPTMMIWTAVQQYYGLRHWIYYSFGWLSFFLGYTVGSPIHFRNFSVWAVYLIIFVNGCLQSSRLKLILQLLSPSLFLNWSLPCFRWIYLWSYLFLELSWTWSLQGSRGVWFRKYLILVYLHLLVMNSKRT